MAKRQIRMDGSYYAAGFTVRQRPKKTKRGVTKGCTVCTISGDVRLSMAKEIAAALNARERQKEWNKVIERNRDEHEA